MANRRTLLLPVSWFDQRPDLSRVETWENVKRRSANSPSGEHRGNHPHKWWIEGEIVLEAAGKQFS